MFSIFIQNIILLASIVIAFIIGRHYAIIHRDKLPTESISDMFSDIHGSMTDKAIPPTARIISPSKRKATELTDLEKNDLV